MEQSEIKRITDRPLDAGITVRPSLRTPGHDDEVLRPSCEPHACLRVHRLALPVPGIAANGAGLMGS